jgi:hypothetical protein
MSGVFWLANDKELGEFLFHIGIFICGQPVMFLF